MTLALTRPERVERLVVVDIAPVAYRHGFEDFITAMLAVDLDRVTRRADADAGAGPGDPRAQGRAFLLQNLEQRDGRFAWRPNLRALLAGMATITGVPALPDARPYRGPCCFDPRRHVRLRPRRAPAAHPRPVPDAELRHDLRAPATGSTPSGRASSSRRSAAVSEAEGDPSTWRRPGPTPWPASRSRSRSLATARPLLAPDLQDLARVEDFVAWMERQPVRYEVIDGRLTMMPGGTRLHSRLAVRVVGSLERQLAGQPCEAFNGDFLLDLGPGRRFYPDAMVVCDETRDWTDRPALVVEVLSELTLAYDLGPSSRPT